MRRPYHPNPNTSPTHYSQQNVVGRILKPITITQVSGNSTSFLINILLFLALLPVIMFFIASPTIKTGGIAGNKEKFLFQIRSCSSINSEFCPYDVEMEQRKGADFSLLDDLTENDVIISVDLLNNWHWCPSALFRMRNELDDKVREFLSKGRRKNSLIIHAVSDSKPHYLNEPGIIKAASKTKATLRVPDGGGRDWGSINKFLLRELKPPPPTSLSLDRTCGDSGRELFGAQKPKGMNGLNETNLDPSYDIVAIDQDVIYTAIKTHKTKIRRILYVGVHLDLCILYSRWFSILRVAKYWDLGEDMQYGIVANLVDMSNSKPKEHFTLQMQRDKEAVENLACWISCVAAPNILGEHRKIQIYDFRTFE
jgi:hypothetical protein